MSTADAGEWMPGKPFPAGPVPAEPPGKFEASMHTRTHLPTADGLGARDNAGKMARYDLIPPEALEALAIHYGQGARKYADRNWERGMSWCKVFASEMRHAWRWFRGDSHDKPDPKMPGYRAHHQIAVAWNAFTAYTYEVRNIGEDDRVIAERGMYAAGPAPDPQQVNFWYLATPYTRFPAGYEAAALLACRLSAKLLRAGVPVFSPIAHSHSIAVAGLQDVQVDHEFWVRADAPLLEAAGGMIVVTAESWEESRGMRHEIEQYQAAGKPIVYWDPAMDIPTCLLP